jgi:hypothetical protein
MDSPISIVTANIHSAHPFLLLETEFLWTGNGPDILVPTTGEWTLTVHKG